MKKSFKRIVAVLLAVMMIVCSFPLTVLAADSNRTNINLQFGDVSNKSTPKNYIVDRVSTTKDFVKHSGLNSTKLEYSNGKIADYSKGDFFTVSVLVENVSKIAAAEVAIKYSDSISPAYIKSTGTGTAVIEYTEDGKAIEGFQPLEAITQQSGDAIHNNETKTLGETSYVDADKKIIHAKYAVQSGSDYADTSSVNAGKYTFTNTAVLATFMFKIVSDEPITFSIDTPKEAYYLETIANGGKVDEYKTYVPKAEGTEAELDFMGKNDYNGSTSTSYTITFKDENGEVLKTGSYEEGAEVIAPALPAVTHDNEKHYTYSWDKEVVSPAAANATYTIKKTGTVHEWNQGVVTKDPTTTETGIKTYTCTFDGCGATKTETLDKLPETHVHTWGEWVYNGDAVRTSATVFKNGTQTRTCSGCGKTETKEAPYTGQLARKGFVLTVDSAILVKAVIETEVVDYYDEVYLVAIKHASDGDRKAVITDYKKELIGGANHYTFVYDETNPQTLNEPVEYTFYGVKNGVTYYGTTINYAVTDYIVNQFNKYSASKYPTSYKNFRRMLADIIWFGYQGQLKTGYGINNGLKKPMIDYIKADELSQRTQTDVTLNDISNMKEVVLENAPVKIGANLRFSSSVDLAFMTAKTTAYDMEKFQFEIRKGDEAPVIYSKATSEDPDKYFGFDNNGNFIFYYDGVKVNDPDTPVYCRVLDENGNPVTNTIKYSIGSYCAKQISKKGSFAQWCDATLRYGMSANDYFANKKA